MTLRIVGGQRNADQHIVDQCIADPCIVVVMAPELNRTRCPDGYQWRETYET